MDGDAVIIASGMAMGTWITAELAMGARAGSVESGEARGTLEMVSVQQCRGWWCDIASAGVTIGSGIGKCDNGRRQVSLEVMGYDR